jgi:hypothetical protein
MIGWFVDYASPSAFESDRERAKLALSANRRRPVRFSGKVKKEHRVGVRLALQTLGELIWSNDEWNDESTYRALVLDPIDTVHPDAIFFEAFSQDQSSYGLVRLYRQIFDAEGDVVTGTTNVDFTAWLHAALGEMRSSRETTITVEAAGLQIATKAHGGRFEKKVDIPEAWIRGFLTLQQAMALPGTRLAVRPVDLLAAIRFLGFSKAKVSPRALRYELQPGEDARLILEPWEHPVRLVGAEHGHVEPRIIRTWGRRRLKLIAPLLPYADAVRIYLKGRALPHFYATAWPGVTFVLGLSGWSENHFAKGGGLALLADPKPPPGSDDALAALARRYAARPEAIAVELGRPLPETVAALDHAVRSGRAIYDLEKREYRYRELLEAPLDLEAIFPEDPKAAAARRHLAEKRWSITSCIARETVKQRRLKTPDGPIDRALIFRDWQVNGQVAEQNEVEVVISQEGRIIFGRCGCRFFKENLLNLGPCEHLLALFDASEPARRDLPSSIATEPKPREAAPTTNEEELDDVDDEEGSEDNDE